MITRTACFVAPIAGVRRRYAEDGAVPLFFLSPAAGQTGVYPMFSYRDANAEEYLKVNLRDDGVQASTPIETCAIAFIRNQFLFGAI